MDKRDLRYYVFALCAGPLAWGMIVTAYAWHRAAAPPEPAEAVHWATFQWIFLQTAVCWYALLWRDLRNEVRQHGWFSACEGLIFSPFPLIALSACGIVATVFITSAPIPIVAVAGLIAVFGSLEGTRRLKGHYHAQLCGRIPAAPPLK